MNKSELEQLINKMMEMQPMLSDRLKMPIHKDVLGMDLSVPHLMTLKILIQSKSPPIISEIGEKLSISFAMMTRVIDRLESCGLVKRVRDKDDRRGIRIEVTLKGLKFADKFHRNHKNNIMNFLKVLDEKDREVFIESIGRMVDILIKYNRVKPGERINNNEKP